MKRRKKKHEIAIEMKKGINNNELEKYNNE